MSALENPTATPFPNTTPEARACPPPAPLRTGGEILRTSLREQVFMGICSLKAFVQSLQGVREKRSFVGDLSHSPCYPTRRWSSSPPDLYGRFFKFHFWWELSSLSSHLKTKVSPNPLCPRLLVFTFRNQNWRWYCFNFAETTCRAKSGQIQLSSSIIATVVVWSLQELSRLKLAKFDFAWYYFAWRVNKINFFL